MLQVLLQLGAGDEVRLRQRAHERDASAWRLGFILCQAIGRANRQAQATSDTALGAAINLRYEVQGTRSEGISVIL